MSRYLRTRVWSLIRKFVLMWTFGGKKTSLFGRVSVWHFVLLGCSFWFMVVSFGNSSLGCRVARTLAWWSIVMQMSYDWIVSHLCLFDMTSNLSEMLHVSPHNPFWWFLLQNIAAHGPHLSQLSTSPIFALVSTPATPCYLFLALLQLNRHPQHPFPPGRLYRCMAAVR